jgi:hypothetical protein
MVANFIDNLNDPVFTKQILKILKKLNQHVPVTVLPQLFSNMYFPGAIVAYLERIDLKDLSGDALILLVNIFDEDNVESASELFINKLFDSLDGIVDEGVTNCVISVILICAPFFEEK